MVYSAVLAACSTDDRGFEPTTFTNVCGHVCKYVDQKDSVAMLTSIQSAGVAPEVNLRNSLHAGDKARKRGIHLALRPRGDVSKTPKPRYQWPHKKDLCPLKSF